MCWLEYQKLWKYTMERCKRFLKTVLGSREKLFAFSLVARMKQWQSNFETPQEIRADIRPTVRTLPEWCVHLYTKHSEHLKIISRNNKKSSSIRAACYAHFIMWPTELCWWCLAFFILVSLLCSYTLGPPHNCLDGLPFYRCYVYTPSFIGYMAIGWSQSQPLELLQSYGPARTERHLPCCSWIHRNLLYMSNHVL